MTISRTVMSVAVLIGLVAGTAVAVNIETVHVGNPGNAGEWSGASYGGHGPDRICGAVDYEYNIGKYEVTAGQYTAFLNAVAKTDTYGLYSTNMWYQYGCKIQRSGSSGSYTYSVAADWANRPVNYVGFWDACRFANWLNNGQPTGAQGAGTTERGTYTLDGYDGDDGRTIQRNPGSKWAVTSEDEWYKAAYHKNDGVTGNYFDYPTSSNSVPSPPWMDPDPGNCATYSTGVAPHYRTEVGAHENSDSPYGTFDQGGNVWEWNEAVFGSHRFLRGGAFSSYDYQLHASNRYEYDPTNDGYVIGFRVSEVPEPTSLAILAFGGIGVLVRRRGLGR